jgi:hypothetical protein
MKNINFALFKVLIHKKKTSAQKFLYYESAWTKNKQLGKYFIPSKISGSLGGEYEDDNSVSR